MVVLDADARPGWCVGARRLMLADEAAVVVLDVSAVGAPDAATVDALARVLLTARRLGRTVRLRGVGPPLHELLLLFGLTDVLPGEAPGTRSSADVQPGPLIGGEARSRPTASTNRFSS